MKKNINATILPSAPSTNPITNCEILLNNLIEQVRECFVFLPENTPTLDFEDNFMDEPKDIFKKLADFHLNFQDAWRKGKDLKFDSQNLDVKNSNNTNTSIKTDPKTFANLDNKQKFDNLKADVLLRSQRIVTIIECVKQNIGKLPDNKQSTYDGSTYIIEDPDTSDHYANEITILQEENKRLNDILKVTTDSLTQFLKHNDKFSNSLSLKLIEEKEREAMP